jgi:hypothetical protein
VNLKTKNFEDLKREFYIHRTAPKATELVRTQKKSDLAWLLRHHREGGITVDESWKRDYFDYLLAYFSILEIALLLGFIDQVPPADRERALKELNHPAVKRYYEENYPLELPTRLRKRISNNEQLKIEDKDGKLKAIFLEYTALTAYFETDPDMETFLWFLDGGGRGEYRYQNLLDVLNSSELLVRSMVRSPEEKTALDASVEGFGKFLGFCVQLDNLLIACEPSKPLQSALFQYYAYWFQRLRKKIGRHMSTALNTYIEADLTRDDEDFCERAEVAIDRLLSGAYTFDEDAVATSPAARVRLSRAASRRK